MPLSFLPKLCFFIFFSLALNAEDRIGLLIQEPGRKALYSRFGHIGLVLETDDPQSLEQPLFEAGYGSYVPRNGRLLFDFGNMDFSDAQFVPNVIRGRMYYLNLIKDLDRFLRYNENNEQRATQVLWLEFSEQEVEQLKQELFRIVDYGNNRYLYDFYFNNCATYPRDLIDQIFKGALKEQTSIIPAPTFRTLVHNALAPYFWSDMLLFFLQGQMLDEQRNLWEASFMPAYLARALLQGKRHNGLPMVKETSWLFARKSPPAAEIPSNFHQAFFNGTLVAALLFLLGFWCRRTNSSLARRCYAAAIFLTSLVPCLLALVVSITSLYYPLKVPQNNLNLLLASPLLLLTLWHSCKLVFSRSSEASWHWIGSIASLHFLLAVINALLWLWLAQKNIAIWLLLTPVHAALSYDFFSRWQKQRNLMKEG